MPTFKGEAVSSVHSSSHPVESKTISREMAPNTLLCNNVTDGCWYDMVSYCLFPKQTLVAFKAIRHTMTVVSIFSTVLSAYIVISSNSVTRVYCSMLVLLLLVWMSMDIVIQWIGDPVFLFPQMCTYRRAPLIDLPISAAAGFGIVQSIVMLGLVNYIALFLYRHQIIVPPGSRFKIPVSGQIAFLAILLAPYLALGIQFYIECIPAIPRYRKWLSQEFFDTSMIAERIDCFPLGNFYYGILAFDGHFAWIFIVSIALHTFHLLRVVKHFSVKTQQLHRILTRSLIVQALTPVVFIILPVTLALVTHIVYINEYPIVMSEWAIMPFDLVLVAVSFHATAHSVSLLATTPAFGTKLREMLPGFVPRQSINSQQSQTGTSFTLT